jgi:hypothetical protein
MKWKMRSEKDKCCNYDLMIGDKNKDCHHVDSYPCMFAYVIFLRGSRKARLELDVVAVEPSPGNHLYDVC